MGLSNLEKAIVILPILGVEDVLSTLYIEYSNRPLKVYETGFFAKYFLNVGLLYLYIPIYLVILLGIAWVMLYIRRSLKPSFLLDKVVFILLIGATCFMDSFLSGVIVSNILIGLGRTLNPIELMDVMRVLVGISVGFTIISYIKKEAVEFLSS